jgi:methyl-accepting chemotaxis protein
MKISMKLAFGFGGMLVIISTIIFSSFYNQNRLGASLKKMDGSNVDLNGYYQLKNSAALISHDVQTLLLYSGRKNILAEIKKIQEERRNYDKIQAELDNTAMAQEGLNIRANIDRNARICRPLLDKIIELALANKRIEATRFWLREARAPLFAWQKSFDEMIAYVNGNSKGEVIAANQIMAVSARWLWILTAVSLIFGIVITVLLMVNITQSVNRITRHIIEGVDEVASASGQLSESSQQLSQGSSEQTSSIEEVLTTFEETASMLQQSTANTRQAAQLSDQAQESADKGGMEMERMMNSMREIRRSSDQIAKIIKVIDEIAFQTNILALNAAIEAARAGDAGLGFAVVAEEVRNLAQKSAQAAQETSAIIEANIDLSREGVSVAEKVRGVLAEITGYTKKVNELMAEIAAASEEQVQGVEQINLSMAQVAVVTQQNAANAEETAAAAEELYAQADGIKKMMQKLSALINGKNASSKKTSADSGQEFHHWNLRPNPSGTLQSNTAEVSPEDIIPLEKDSNHF